VGASTSAVFIALMHIFPDLPINNGTFRQLDVNIPEGTFLNATYPKPVSGCASEVPSRVIDVVIASLGKAEPSLAQAGACSTSANFTLHGPQRRARIHHVLLRRWRVRRARRR
jgi:N-methylhydantoinase B